MAKTCQIARQQRRMKKVDLHRAKRTELKKLIANAATSPEDRFAAVRQLDEMPRDGSRTRLSNRCSITGRPRAYMRTFGLCRIKFREMAGQGYLPGVTMASW